MKRSHGFTLTEALVAMAVFAVLMALGAPSFVAYTNNSRLRAEAESLLSGLQTARSEAVRLNAPVEFVMTNENPTESSVNTTSLSATGRNWMVRTKDPADPTQVNYLLVAGKPAKSGSGRSDGTSTVTVAAAVGGTAINRMRFNSLSSLEVDDAAATASAIFEVRNPSAGACHTASEPSPLRCLNVVVAPSGQTRICDPSITENTDPRKC